jgi:hypothetical protein
MRTSPCFLCCDCVPPPALPPPVCLHVCRSVCVFCIVLLTCPSPCVNHCCSTLHCCLTERRPGLTPAASIQHRASDPTRCASSSCGSRARHSCARQPPEWCRQCCEAPWRACSRRGGPLHTWPREAGGPHSRPRGPCGCPVPTGHRVWSGPPCWIGPRGWKRGPVSWVPGARACPAQRLHTTAVTDRGWRAQWQW